jgi:hypothetical protein
MRFKQLRWSMKLVSAVTSCIFITGVCAAADVLSFQAAANQGTGCTTIPYPVYERECSNYQTEKNKLCHSYKHERSAVEKLLKRIEEKKKNLDEAKNRNNRAAIPDLEKAIAEARDEVNKKKADAAAKIQRCNECIAARKRVQRVFSEVKAKVLAETDEGVQPFIQPLVRKYEQGAQDHQQAIVDVENAKAGWVWIKDANVP